MKPIKIKISNYGSFYGDFEVSLADQGLVLVTGENLDEPRMDSNGSGKSTIFDALDWALWGKSPRGDHADSMINEEVAQERGAQCAVEVQILDDSGELITIKRTRGKSSRQLTLQCGSRDLTTLDTEETQRTIAQVLGLTRDVFHSAVLFGQTDLAHYADSGDAARMEALTGIIQELQGLDEYQDTTKQLLRETEGKREELEKNAVRLRGQIAGLEQDTPAVRAAMWDQNHGELVAGLEAELAGRQADANAARARFVALEPIRAEIAAKVEELNRPVAPVIPGALLHEARGAIAIWSKAVGEADATLRAQLDRVRLIGGGVCPTCRQSVSAAIWDGHQSEVANAAESQRRAREGLRVAQEHLQSLETQIRQADSAYQEWRRQMTLELRPLQSRVVELEALERNLEKHDRVVAIVAGRLQGERETVNPHLAIVAAHQAALSQCQMELAAAEDQIATIGTALEYLEFWVAGFGAAGLKSYILDARLQQLTDAANRWVKLLTGGTIWIRFESQRQTRGKKFVNAPDIRVFRWNPDHTVTERNYASWSGGEKQRISFAIDFGLSQLIASRARNRYDLLILDEVFQHLDRAGKEAVMEMLKEMTAEKTSLFVVEHDAEFQGQFDRRWHVVKQGRRSILRGDENGPKAKRDEGAVPRSDFPAPTASKRKPVVRA